MMSVTFLATKGRAPQFDMKMSHHSTPTTQHQIRMPAAAFDRRPLFARRLAPPCWFQDGPGRAR